MEMGAEAGVEGGAEFALWSDVKLSAPPDAGVHVPGRRSDHRTPVPAARKEKLALWPRWKHVNSSA